MHTGIDTVGNAQENASNALERPAKNGVSFNITDVASDNNTYLNEIWSRYSTSQVDDLSRITGVAPENIVTEQAKWYNRINNPDTGTGITLNQGSSDAFGLPEFFAKDRVGVANGVIYEVVGDTRTKVGVIGPDGIITLLTKK